MNLQDDKESDSKSEIYDTNVIDIAYLKAINVPCMYDMGTMPIDPAESRLLLHILDDISYHKVVKPDFIQGKRKQQKKKIEKFR